MSEPTVHVVDDDLAIRDALRWLFRSRGVRAQAWESGEAFLQTLSQEARGCVVLDVRMDGMSGIEVFDQMLSRGLRIPVIFLTGHGDVPLAVAALKKGAFDFVEKPFNDNQLVDRAVEAMRLDEALRQEQQAEATVAARLARLTPREREVMELIAEGRSNQAIADRLFVTLRAVEKHVTSIFTKLGLPASTDDHRRVLAVLKYLRA